MNPETWIDPSNVDFHRDNLLDLCRHLKHFEGFDAAYPSMLSTNIVDDKRAWKFTKPEDINQLDLGWVAFIRPMIIAINDYNVYIIIPFDTSESTISQLILKDLRLIHFSATQQVEESPYKVSVALLFYEVNKNNCVNCCIYEIQFGHPLQLIG